MRVLKRSAMARFSVSAFLTPHARDAHLFPSSVEQRGLVAMLDRPGAWHPNGKLLACRHLQQILEQAHLAIPGDLLPEQGVTHEKLAPIPWTVRTVRGPSRGPFRGPLYFHTFCPVDRKFY